MTTREEKRLAEEKAAADAAAAGGEGAGASPEGAVARDGAGEVRPGVEPTDQEREDQAAANRIKDDEAMGGGKEDEARVAAIAKDIEDKRIAAIDAVHKAGREKDAKEGIFPKSHIQKRQEERDAELADIYKAQTRGAPGHLPDPAKSEVEMAREREVARNTPQRRGG